MTTPFVTPVCKNLFYISIRNAGNTDITHLLKTSIFYSSHKHSHHLHRAPLYMACVTLHTSVFYENSSSTVRHYAKISSTWTPLLRKIKSDRFLTVHVWSLGTMNLHKQRSWGAPKASERACVREKDYVRWEMRLMEMCLVTLQSALDRENQHYNTCKFVCVLQKETKSCHGHLNTVVL